jgi:putative transcriptional regulator
VAWSQLKAERMARGWTQRDLARELGVSRQTVNAIESGRHLPSLGLAFTLAARLDTQVERLFDADGPRPWDGQMPECFWVPVT